MAIISALFALLGQKLNGFLKAVFGWSIMALFGRLSAGKQASVSRALLLSLLWPILVVGNFKPAVATWLVAFVPLHQFVGHGVVRVIFIALAIATPLIVALLTRHAAPSTKGSVFWALLNGYPLALGYLCAFIITAVTVPIVKLVSAVRRWADDHVFLQPRPDRYNAVIDDLVDACHRSGVEPKVEAVPLFLSLSTKVLKFLARGAINPIVENEPKMLRAKGLQIYMYPADLMLRGEPRAVAHVRAMMTRTDIERDAYIVETPRAQELQDALGEAHDDVRIAQLSTELDDADIPFADWSLLEQMLLRHQARLHGDTTLAVSGHTAGGGLALRSSMRTSALAVVLGMLAVNTVGCVAVGTRHSGFVFGGGGIGLFVVIIVLALIFGKRR